MIAGLPQGPAGFALFIALVVLAWVIVASAHPIFNWIERLGEKRERRRAEERELYYRLEAMHNDELFNENRKEVK